MQQPGPATVDPLDSPSSHPDAYRGAVLLSDQIEFYIMELDPPLLANPDGSRLSDVDLWDSDKGCLDTASYKLRLGGEAHIGGNRVQISRNEPLVLPPHQVAIVQTYEIVNIPRFLVARWNLRVQWVYEGLLWVGGPQVDPGWQGELYCPIYNLAEREVVIPYLDRVFTMDFTRTTPVHDDEATYGYKTKVHKPARRKNIQGHDVNRLHSAPFEALTRLATLDNRVNSFISLTFLVLAVVVAALGVVAALSGGGGTAVSEVIKGEQGLLALLAVALVFGLSAMFISSITMGSRLGQPPQGRGWLTTITLVGVVALSLGMGYAAVLITSGPPDWQSKLLKVLLGAGTGTIIFVGFTLLYLVWFRATRTPPIQADVNLGLEIQRRAFSIRVNQRGFSIGLVCYP